MMYVIVILSELNNSIDFSRNLFHINGILKQPFFIIEARDSCLSCASQNHILMLSRYYAFGQVLKLCLVTYQSFTFQ